MIVFTEPMAVQFIRDGVVSHTVVLAPSDIAGNINGVYAAYCKQHNGGLRTCEDFDAVVSPVVSTPGVRPQANTPPEMLESISYVKVQLKPADGAAAFEQVLSFVDLSGAAISLFYRNGAAGDVTAFHWRLVCTGASDEDAGQGAGDQIIIEDQVRETPVEPASGPRPYGRLVAGIDPGDVPVYVTREALSAMMSSVRSAAGAYEPGGALIGRLMQDERGLHMLVTDAPLLTMGGKQSVTFDYRTFAQVREYLRGQEGLSLLGFYHAHPPEYDEQAVFASAQDLLSFTNFASEPYSIMAIAGGRTYDRLAFYAYNTEGRVQRVGYHIVRPTPAAGRTRKEVISSGNTA